MLHVGEQTSDERGQVNDMRRFDPLHQGQGRLEVPEVAVLARGKVPLLALGPLAEPRPDRFGVDDVFERRADETGACTSSHERRRAGASMKERSSAPPVTRMVASGGDILAG